MQFAFYNRRIIIITIIIVQQSASAVDRVVVHFETIPKSEGIDRVYTRRIINKILILYTHIYMYTHDESTREKAPQPSGPCADIIILYIIIVYIT